MTAPGLTPVKLKQTNIRFGLVLYVLPKQWTTRNVYKHIQCLIYHCRLNSAGWGNCIKSTAALLQWTLREKVRVLWGETVRQSEQGAKLRNFYKVTSPDLCSATQINGTTVFFLLIFTFTFSAGSWLFPLTFTWSQQLQCLRMLGFFCAVENNGRFNISSNAVVFLWGKCILADLKVSLTNLKLV